MNLPSYEYYKKILEGKRMPCAFVDLDLLDGNIKNIVERAENKKVRIASKSIRCEGIIKRILNSDDAYQGIMCFHAEEAIFLESKGYDDLLIAYPTINKPAIETIAKLIKKGSNIYLMVDLEEHVALIDEIAKLENCVIPICVDLDLSVDFPGLHFGVYRSSITSMEKLEVFASSLKKYNNVELVGLMGYEAQIAGVGDNYPGQAIKNQVVKGLKKQSVKKIAQKRKQAVELLTSKGFNLKFVNGGGTGSLETTRQESVVTEVTAGSGFYASGLFDNYSNFKHYPAAAFALAVTRNPKDDIYTCLGGGYIASGAISMDKMPKPYLPQGINLFANEGMGEVQTPIKSKLKLNLGDPILFRHSKAGELCERFNNLHLISNGEIINTVPTYRGEGKCFL